MADSAKPSTMQTDLESQIAQSAKVRGIAMAPDVKPEDRGKAYDHWAETYDQDVTNLYSYGKVADEPSIRPQQVAANVLESLFEGRTLQELKILDCACGTGKLGEHLLKKGFSQLDGVDYSQKMLEKAREKNIYGRTIFDMLGKNKLEIAGDTYDATICVSSLIPGHVSGDCFEELCRITKPGGFCVFTVREEYYPGAYKDNIEGNIQELCDKGAWTQVIRRQEPNCPTGITINVYVYKKC